MQNELDDLRRDRFDLEQLERAPAALTRDELIFFTRFAHDDRLEQALGADAFREFAELATKQEYTIIFPAYYFGQISLAFC